LVGIFCASKSLDESSKHTTFSTARDRSRSRLAHSCASLTTGISSTACAAAISIRTVYVEARIGKSRLEWIVQPPPADMAGLGSNALPPFKVIVVWSQDSGHRGRYVQFVTALPVPKTQAYRLLGLSVSSSPATVKRMRKSISMTGIAEVMRRELEGRCSEERQPPHHECGRAMSLRREVRVLNSYKAKNSAPKRTVS
jgi:hypothetical protein